MSTFAAKSILAISVALSSWAKLHVSAALAGQRAFRGHRAAPPAAFPNGGLFDELEQALGHGLRKASEARASELEEVMRPIFASLPKTPEGGLPWSGARYLLHRVFVVRHNWQVHGIVDSGDGWASTSPSVVFAEHFGDAMASLLERRADGGVSLHDAAVFAAALEGLAHEEVVERLHAAYRVAGVDTTHEDGAEEGAIERVLDAYMLMYVRKVNHTVATSEEIAELLDEYRAPSWNATKAWVREVRREVVDTAPESRSSFSTTVRAIEEAMDRYGRWQNYECEDMKADLMKIENNGTGRVLLSDFYLAALGGQSLFSEAKGYLRELGALDETNPSAPSVIIPNYVNAPSNCLAGSQYYSVCCLNECESLLKPLEDHIAAPDAGPSQIVALVEQLASPTVVAPRRLPRALIDRLEEIAAQHDGRVPLHGRLFAQWMHHAFPRECPFPHLAGTTAPMKGYEWLQKTGESFLADQEAMTRHINECTWDGGAGAQELAAHDGAVASTLPMPWSPKEELQIHHEPRSSRPRATPERSALSFLRTAMLIAAMVSMALGMTWTATRTSSTIRGGSGKVKVFSEYDKYYA